MPHRAKRKEGIDLETLLRTEGKRTRVGDETLLIYPIGMIGSPPRMNEWVLLEVGHCPPHYHDGTAVSLLFLGGNGTCLVGKECLEYAKGTEILIPKSTLHGFRVIETTVVLSIQQDQPIVQKRGNREIVDFRAPTHIEWPEGETV